MLTSDSNYLNHAAVAFVDKQIGFLRIMPKPSFLASDAAAPLQPVQPGAPVKVATLALADHDKGKAAMKEKVPRPPNAFILYRQHHHPILKKANPALHNNDICEFISRIYF